MASIRLVRNRSLFSLILTAFVLVFVWISVFLRSESYEPISDDLLYAYVLDDKPLGENDYSRRVDSFSDAVESQVQQYFHTNGRTLLHVMVQMFAGPWGYTAWSIFLASLITFAVFLFMKVVNKGYMRSPLMWMLTAVSFLYLYQYNGRIWFSIVGGMNYLWPLVMTLCWIGLVRLANGSKSWVLWPLGILVSIFAGWGMECYTLPLCAAVFVSLILDRKKLQLTPLQTVMIVCLWAGAAILTLAPGNFCRVKNGSVLVRFLSGIEFLAGTVPFWLLVVSMIFMRLRGRGIVKSFVQQNRFWWLCFGWSLALGMVANTLPQSFNGVSFFCLVLVFRSIPTFIQFKQGGVLRCASVDYALAICFLILFSVHQTSVLACVKQVEDRHRELIREYLASSDGILQRPDIQISLPNSLFVDSWTKSNVIWWFLHTIDCGYTNGQKPIIMLDSLDYMAVKAPDSFFVESNKVSGNSCLYMGNKYLWSPEKPESSDSLIFNFYPISREDVGSGLVNTIWYYLKASEQPKMQYFAIPDTNCVNIPGAPFAIKKPFRRKIDSVQIKQRSVSE